MNRKWLILVAVLAGVGLYYYFGLGQVLSLDNLKMQRDRLHGFYEHHAVEMSLGFILVYILVAGLSLPGATILTLGGGAIFGSVMGTLFVNIGATLGATIAFLAARFLLRDWVEGKFGERLQAFNQGFSRSALNYLLFLRLVPLFPFFVVNLVSGLTRIPLRTYFFGTMFGILPGTFVYANAGSNLAAINSLSDIASPGMLGAFALLGCFALVPTLYRKFKNRKTPAPATDL